MDKEKSNGNGSGIKNRFTKMLFRSACTTDTTNRSTSFITISKNGTNGTSGTTKGNEEPPGTPSLFDLLNKHRYERKISIDSRPKLDKNLSGRTAPVVQISIDCTGRRSLTGTNKLVPIPLPIPVPKKEEDEKKKKKKHSSNGYNSRKCSPVSSSSPSTKFYYSNHETRRNKNTIKPRRKGTKKLHSNPYGFSTSSSAHSDMETGLFSSEGEREEEETQTLFSSKSFSSDSSEFYQRTNKPNTQLKSKQSPLKPVKKPVPISKDKTNTLKPVKKPLPISNDGTNPRKPVKKPVPISKDKTKEETEINKKPLNSVSSNEKKPTEISTGTGTGTGTGTAVVKKSSDPYMDFRCSMVEMILEEKVVCVKEMERLLKSYLALNAARHHPIIVRAFEDICEAIFSK
ncbi:hypothetical protein LUZ60_008458 [Juncus effusus]|nr:hypothetical protein LUZ60_008458 [Juncus effusus]